MRIYKNLIIGLIASVLLIGCGQSQNENSFNEIKSNLESDNKIEGELNKADSYTGKYTYYFYLDNMEPGDSYKFYLDFDENTVEYVENGSLHEKSTMTKSQRKHNWKVVAIDEYTHDVGRKESEIRINYTKTSEVNTTLLENSQGVIVDKDFDFQLYKIYEDYGMETRDEVVDYDRYVQIMDEYRLHEMRDSNYNTYDDENSNYAIKYIWGHGWVTYIRLDPIDGNKWNLDYGTHGDTTSDQYCYIFVTPTNLPVGTEIE